MGRRKIEIKAIKDDRNRSVGGLFKKAHELAVLCSVDVAVIIFGQNKKLYEYSSCDMHDALGRYQYFGGPHEHKGPDDFSGKRDDDDDEDDMTPAPEDIQAVQTQSAVPPHLQQPGFQHINHAPSASPPIPNGLPITRHVSNLGPQQHATPPPQNGFAYMSNPSMYNPNVHGPMNQARPGQFPHQYGHPGPQGTPPHISHIYNIHMPGGPQQLAMAQGPPPVPQVQQTYIAEQNRGSMPPAFAHEPPHHDRSVPVENSDHMNAGMRPDPSQSPPQPKTSKSHSIFTPIDDRGSVLARHFGGPAPVYEAPRGPPTKVEPPEDSRPSNISAPPEPTRTQSISSTPDLKPPQRTNSGALNSKRPQLKVQIPSENSDRGSATAESSDRDSAGNRTSTPAKGNNENPPTSVVLPPPSPSAGAILSAGAQGPPNPFARPPPPATQSGNAYGNNGASANNGNNSNNIETPISALPSRFVSDALLPSPSSFFPEWGFGRSGPDSNLLPSPLTFPTPAVQSGPSFSREDEQDKKRKSPDNGQGRIRRIKSPNPSICILKRPEKPFPT
ncbi:hypothetical protein N7468_009490 [Penicillium chermesinum]|uniref:MADS-box domain-containing protein n=1 Tax=Penicillium chermesinum TaxID=63820 RepID=A0A9W9NI79_9EURO|nr:uncharacterized protein N7468_009490 [Penicillium chermesinum]KAJ5220286.1 hypothetical protein N7468_009490 [Penicillium chermesinum]